MSYLRERVSYLKGLAEGVTVSENTGEGKLLKAIIDVLDDFALAIGEIEEIQEEFNDQVESLDSDLAEVEKEVFDIDYDDEEDDEEEDDEDGYEDDVEAIEINCPHCGELVVLDEEILNDDKDVFDCPKCGKPIEIEWDCSCEHCRDENENEKEVE